MRVLIVTQGGGADLAPLESRLREQGHTVLTVTREADAPATWRGGACGLVLVDAREDVSRVPLVRALRSLPGAEASVLMLVGHRGGLGALRPALNAGADDLLTWPLDDEELALRLELASRRHARRGERMGTVRGIAQDLKSNSRMGPAERAEVDIRQVLGSPLETSEAGRGSPFQVLPPPSQRAAGPPPPPPPAPMEKRGRLLVVDDEPRVCTALGRTLGPHHDVTLATRAQEALDRIEAGERFDVIFCDLMMPGMSGMDFYAALRARHPEQAERVIFLTGGAVTQQARTFLESVPSPHLEKPFAGRELLSLIQERLAHA